MSEKALIEFVKWAISEGPFEGCHLDGGSIQDKAEKLGILIKTKYDRTKHGESAEADDGDDWYEFAPWIALPPLRAREEILSILREKIRLVARPDYEETETWMVKYGCLEQCADAILALSSTAGQAPGHTDLIVTPESVDAFMEANPLPDEPIVAEQREVKP